MGEGLLKPLFFACDPWKIIQRTTKCKFVTDFVKSTHDTMEITLLTYTSSKVCRPSMYAPNEKADFDVDV